MKKTEKFLLLPSYPETILSFRGNLIKLIAKKYIVYVACPKLSTNLQKEFKELNINHIELPLVNYSITPLRDLYVFLKLNYLIFKLKPTKILSYTIKPNFYGSIAARLQNIDFYPMFTGLGTFFEEKKNLFKSLIVQIMRFGLKKSKKIIFYNSANMETFIELGICDPKQAVIVNGSGLDIDFYKTNTKNVVGDPEKLIFLCSARILKDKGIVEYLEAAELIKSKYQDVEFWLIGWFQNSKYSINKNTLQKYVEKGVINFLGYKEDVRGFIDLCDVFILPSYHEGMPRSALEAMSMSKAVILSNIPGTQELIQEGKNGFYCEPRSTNSLVTSIEKILSNKKNITNFGKKSRKLIESKFDDKIINKKLLEILDISI